MRHIHRIMRLTLTELRHIIADVIAEAKAAEPKPPKPDPKAKTKPSRMGGIPITDDPAFDEDALIVYPDAKKKIRKWMKDMGLTTEAKRR